MLNIVEFSYEFFTTQFNFVLSILQTGISNLLYKINGVGVHFWKCNMHLDVCTQMKVNSYFFGICFVFFLGYFFFMQEL